MHRLLIGTQNPGKIREYQELLEGLPLAIVGLGEVQLGDHEVEETGATFTENAQLKASAYARASGLMALSDDSGLSIDALDGRPGLYSARYGGPGLDERGRRLKVLDEMRGIADRGAQFECVIAVFDPARDQLLLAEGICRGQIAPEELDGPNGFGYDPIFIPDGYDTSFARLPKDLKNTLSHRGRALAALLPMLTAYLDAQAG
jgi:XTP/dITP diphosphohydrolase